CPRTPANQPIPEPRERAAYPRRMDVDGEIQPEEPLPDCPATPSKRKPGNDARMVRHRRCLLDELNCARRLRYECRVFPPLAPKKTALTKSKLCLSRNVGILPRPYHSKARRDILKLPFYQARLMVIEDPTYKYVDLDCLRQALSQMNLVGIPETPGAPIKAKRHQASNRAMSHEEPMLEDTDESRKDDDG
ncbi:hypothetical protein ElyMa_000669000, partial [Elysia marginata]